jgi:hypothetical protein
MRYTTHRRIAALVLIALAGACSSDSSVGPSNPAPASLDKVFGEMSLPELSIAVAVAAPSAGTMGLLPPVPQGCSYDASAHGFVCPTFSASGLSVAQSYMLYDKAGNSQSQYDPASTDAVRIVTTMSGTESLVSTSATINSTQDVKLSGLQSGMHLLSGTTNIHVTETGLPAAGPTDITTVITIANVVMPSGNQRWPQSGTITIDLTTASTRLFGTSSLHMVLTFNGTGKVPVTIRAGTLTSTCVIDLTGLSPVSCTP